MVQVQGDDVVTRVTLDHAQFERDTKRVEGMFDQMGQAVAPLRAGVLGLELALGALGAEAVQAAGEINGAVQSMGFLTGTTGDGLQQMKQEMIDIARVAPDGFDEIGSTLAQVQARTQETGEAAERSADKYLKLAHAMGEDSGRITTLGLNVQQSWKVGEESLDKFLVAAQKVGRRGALGDLMQGMSEFGPRFRTMGMSFDEGLAILTNFQQKGLSASASMMALNQAAGVLGGDDRRLGQAIQRIRELYEGGNKAEAIALSRKIFGARGMTAVTDAIEQGAFSTRKLTEEFERAEGAVEKIKFNSLSDTLAILRNELNIDLAPLGNAIGSIVRGVLPLARVLGEVVGWVGRLAESPFGQTVIRWGIGLLVFNQMLTGTVGLAGRLVTFFQNGGLRTMFNSMNPITNLRNAYASGAEAATTTANTAAIVRNTAASAAQARAKLQVAENTFNLVLQEYKQVMADEQASASTIKLTADTYKLALAKRDLAAANAAAAESAAADAAAEANLARVGVAGAGARGAGMAAGGIGMALGELMPVALVVTIALAALPFIVDAFNPPGKSGVEGNADRQKALDRRYAMLQEEYAHYERVKGHGGQEADEARKRVQDTLTKIYKHYGEEMPDISSDEGMKRAVEQSNKNLPVHQAKDKVKEIRSKLWDDYFNREGFSFGDISEAEKKKLMDNYKNLTPDQLVKIAEGVQREKVDNNKLLLPGERAKYTEQTKVFKQHAEELRDALATLSDAEQGLIKPEEDTEAKKLQQQQQQLLVMQEKIALADAASREEEAGIQRVINAQQLAFDRQWANTRVMRDLVGGMYAVQSKADEDRMAAQIEHDNAVQQADQKRKEDLRKLALDEFMSDTQRSAQTRQIEATHREALDNAFTKLQAKNLQIDMTVKKETLDAVKQKLQGAFDLTFADPRFKEGYRAAFDGLNGYMARAGLLASPAGAPANISLPSPVAGSQGGPANIVLRVVENKEGMTRFVVQQVDKRVPVHIEQMASSVA